MAERRRLRQIPAEKLAAESSDLRTLGAHASGVLARIPVHGGCTVRVQMAVKQSAGTGRQGCALRSRSRRPCCIRPVDELASTAKQAGMTLGGTERRPWPPCSVTDAWHFFTEGHCLYRGRLDGLNSRTRAERTGREGRSVRWRRGNEEAAPGSSITSRRRRLPPTPEARHLPGLTKKIQLPQNNRLAARWRLGRGNARIRSLSK